MFQSLELFTTAGAMARHAGKRQAIVAGNVANADTPGYRTRGIADFADVMDPAAPDAMRATRARHLNGTHPGALPQARVAETTEREPNGNSVSVETELMKGVAARRQHDQALAIYRAGLSLLRASLGRR